MVSLQTNTYDYSMAISYIGNRKIDHFESGFSFIRFIVGKCLCVFYVDYRNTIRKTPNRVLL